MTVNSSLLGLLLGVIASLFSAGTRGDEVQTLWQTQGPISVLRGQDFTLECRVPGLPSPGPVKWFVGKGPTRKLIYSDREPSDRVTRTQPRSNTDFTISIRNSVPEDAGIYYCIKQKKVFGDGGEEDLESGPGTEVVVKFELETQPQNPEPSPRHDSPGGVNHGQKDHRDDIIPVVAGTVCVLLAVLLSVALYFYIKKKRGKKSCPSRPEDLLPENPRTPHQTPADKEIVYADVKHSSGVQTLRQSKLEETSTYATIR